jgi:hypothetical protein
MPYERQYDSIFHTAKSFGLYQAADGSFDIDAFDAAYEESFNWAQRTFNPSNRQALAWEDFVRYKAEYRLFQNLCMSDLSCLSSVSASNCTTVGSGSRFAQFNARFQGEAPPDPRPAIDPRGNADATRGQQYLQQQPQPQLRRKTRDDYSRAERSDDRHRDPRYLSPLRAPISNRSPSPRSQVQRRRTRSPTRQESRSRSRRDTHRRSTRSRSPLSPRKTSTSKKQKSLSSSGLRSRTSPSNITQRGRTMYDEPQERQQRQEEDKPRLPHRPPPQSGGREGVSILLATGSDTATQELTPFFALLAGGHPRFGAYSMDPEAKHCFVGPKGDYIKALERRFHTLRIRCEKACGGKVYFWAELGKDQRSKSRGGYFTVDPETYKALKKAEKLLLDYAALPKLPHIDNFLHRYHDGEYHPPGSRPRRSRGTPIQGSDASVQEGEEVEKQGEVQDKRNPRR